MRIQKVAVRSSPTSRVLTKLYVRGVARLPRRELADGLYHVTSRGVRRQQIFCDERDTKRFLAQLCITVNRFRWQCHAYCLMPNHYHLVVTTTTKQLSAGMHRLNGSYAQWFNSRYELGGHLFEGRFHAACMEREGHVLEVARYVVLNPVRAGLCRNPVDWPWSSYRATVGRAPVPSFLTLDVLLSHFGAERESATASFMKFVSDARESAATVDRALAGLSRPGPPPRRTAAG